MERHLGQVCEHIATDSAEARVTQTGGHLGPVRFRLGDRWIEPFSVAPWHDESIGPENPPIIRVLRGDFFCLPFGGNSTPYNGEQHPVHGDTANVDWALAVNGALILSSLQTQTRPGKVRKEIALREGHSAVYSRHTVEMDGPMCFGHHAMLKFNSPGLVSVSSIAYGQVFPGQFEHPSQGGYSWLKPGARFYSLGEVPAIDGGLADLTRYPAREGFEDLVMVCADPSLDMAWTAVTFPEEGFVYFAIRDPKVLASTVLWHSNGGRHYPPWNGRHRGVLGVEDVTAYFHCGLAESVEPNPVQAAGFETSKLLSQDHPLDVRYVMGVAATPAGFGAVDSIAVENSQVILFSGNDRATAKCDVGFLTA